MQRRPAPGAAAGVRHGLDPHPGLRAWEASGPRLVPAAALWAGLLLLCTVVAPAFEEAQQGCCSEGFPTACIVRWRPHWASTNIGCSSSSAIAGGRHAPLPHAIAGHSGRPCWVLVLPGRQLSAQAASGNRCLLFGVTWLPRCGSGPLTAATLPGLEAVSGCAPPAAMLRVECARQGEPWPPAKREGSCRPRSSRVGCLHLV